MENKGLCRQDSKDKEQNRVKVAHAKKPNL